MTRARDLGDFIPPNGGGGGGGNHTGSIQQSIKWVTTDASPASGVNLHWYIYTFEIGGTAGHNLATAGALNIMDGTALHRT